MNYKSLPLIVGACALLFGGCQSPPKHTPAYILGSSYAIPGKGVPKACLPYAAHIALDLHKVGVKNIRWACMDVGGQESKHIVTLYDDDGRRWIVDNEQPFPRHAVGGTLEEQCQRFANPPGMIGKWVGNVVESTPKFPKPSN